MNQTCDLSNIFLYSFLKYEWPRFLIFRGISSQIFDTENLNGCIHKHGYIKE